MTNLLFAPRLLIASAAMLVATCGAGCGTYNYEYVLHVECEARRTPGEIGGYVGANPIEVTIECDGSTKKVQFNPRGETRTIRFGERYRIMIDGDAVSRGFSVAVRREGYKPWNADYQRKGLMVTSGGGEGGSYIRLDSVELALADGDAPSRQISGGPEKISLKEK